MTRWLVVLMLAGLPAGACLWDNDTLTMETKRFPNLAEVIAGKFDRNPPRYYEMRMARATAALRTSPEAFELYDDVAVAWDRLGNDDEAIKEMDAKRRAMGEHPPAEAQYRMLANSGTFHVHRWIHHGADRRDTADLDRSVELLEAAIKLNPDAHFGRERYQLEAVKRIRTPPRPESKDDHWPALFGEAFGPAPVASRNVAQVAADEKGITGLIVLGAAWESVDVYRGLARALVGGNHARVAYLAQLRAEELVRAGRTSLFPGAPTGEELVTAMAEPEMTLDEIDKPKVAAAFRAMRAEADRWHESRTRYLEAHLIVGRHPDTDAEFWDLWVPPPTPTIDNPPEAGGSPLLAPGGLRRALWRLALVAALLLASPVCLYVLCRWVLARRAARAG